MRFLARANLLMALSLLIVAGAYWSARLAKEPLRDQLRQSVVQKSFAVTGELVPFDIGLASRKPVLRPGKHLLLVAADDCVAMPTALPVWSEVIKSLPIELVGSVILVTRGERIARVLTQAANEAGVPIEIVQKDNTTAWARRSGMTATPSVFALDEAGRVQLCLRNLDAKERSALAAYFRGV